MDTQPVIGPAAVLDVDRRLAAAGILQELLIDRNVLFG